MVLMKVSLEDEVEWETNMDKRESSKHSKISQAIDNLSKESPFFSNNPAKNHPIFQRDGEFILSMQHKRLINIDKSSKSIIVIYTL